MAIPSPTDQIINYAQELEAIYEKEQDLSHILIRDASPDSKHHFEIEDSSLFGRFKRFFISFFLNPFREVKLYDNEANLQRIHDLFEKIEVRDEDQRADEIMVLFAGRMNDLAKLKGLNLSFTYTSKYVKAIQEAVINAAPNEKLRAIVEAAAEQDLTEVSEDEARLITENFQRECVEKAVEASSQLQSSPELDAEKVENVQLLLQTSQTDIPELKEALNTYKAPKGEERSLHINSRVGQFARGVFRVATHPVVLGPIAVEVGNMLMGQQMSITSATMAVVAPVASLLLTDRMTRGIPESYRVLVQPLVALGISAGLNTYAQSVVHMREEVAITPLNTINPFNMTSPVPPVAVPSMPMSPVGSEPIAFFETAPLYGEPQSFTSIPPEPLLNVAPEPPLAPQEENLPIPETDVRDMISTARQATVAFMNWFSPLNLLKK